MISILLPVRNGASFLEESARSILDQSIGEIELIIIDDGSTDNTVDFIRQISKQDQRVVSVSTPGIGISGALNAGIDKSTGDFIGRMDADDISERHRLKRQLEYLRSKRLDFVGSQGREFGLTNRLMRRPISPDLCAASLLIAPPLIHPSVIGRATCFRKLRYREHIKYGQDYDLWTRAVLNGWRIGNCPEVLIRYRTHTEQISQSNRTERFAITRAVQRNFWSQFLKESASQGLAFDFIFGHVEYSILVSAALARLLEFPNRAVVRVLAPYISRALLKKSASRAEAHNRWRQVLSVSQSWVPVRELIRMSALGTLTETLRSLRVNL